MSSKLADGSIVKPELARHTPNTKGKTVRIVSPHSTASGSDNDDEGRAKDYFEATSKYRRGPHSPMPLSSAFRSAKEALTTDPFEVQTGTDESSDEEKPSLKPGNKTSDESKVAEQIPILSSSTPRDALLPFNNIENRRDNVEDESRELEVLNKHPQTLSQVNHKGNHETASNPFSKPMLPGLITEKIPSSAQQDIQTRSTNSLGAAGGKVHLDVDEFKRLLLTGDKALTSSGASEIPAAHATPLQSMHGDSSSNTDTSSLSRQSILDSQTDLRLETPRTSHEISTSDEEQQFKASIRSPSSKRSLPPVPRSRGGKTMKSSSPRTTTFPNFALAESQERPEIQSTLPSPKSSTNLNKPLPLPPIADQPEIPPELSTELSDAPASRSRIPPPPPLSRRHSQLRSKGTTSSPRASASIPEGISSESHHEDSPLSAIPKASAPPPPPPRRKGRDRSQSSSENPSLTDLSSQVQPQSAKPPPPPSRNPHVLPARLPARESPRTSIGSTTAPSPPPRRRASSGSSFGSTRRVSNDISNLNSGSNTIMQLTQAHDYSITPVTEGTDIMADLSALQREVDALRGKYDQGPG